MAVDSMPGVARQVGDCLSGWTRVVATLLVVFSIASAVPVSVQAATLTPEVERGLAWLQAQVRADGSVGLEESAMAHPMQVRCEVNNTIAYFLTPGLRPICWKYGVTLTEILARNGSALPATYWLSDGGVKPDESYSGSGVIDTSWALSASSLTEGQRLGAVNFLFAHQAPSGGFVAGSDGPETVAASSMIGRQLALQTQLSGTQYQQLDAAATWVKAQASSVGVWSSVYETALAHLFLAVQSPDAVRDAATYEYFVGTQQTNGSWDNDPFLTALVLRAAATRSTPKTVDSGYTLRVIDAVTKAPVKDANVVGGKSVMTDAAGYANVQTPSASNLAISISKGGYQTAQLTANIPAGATVELGEVLLEPLATSVRMFGHVVDEVTRQPLQNVSVYVYVDGVFSRLLSSDTNGYYDGYLAKAGQYRLEFSLANYVSRTAEFSGVLGESDQVDAALAAKATSSDGGVKGAIADTATSLPLKGAMVYWRGNSGATKLTYSLADGSYQLDGLLRESGELSFSLAGYLGKKASGVVPANPAPGINISLDKTATLPTSGKVYGYAKDKSSALPLAGVAIDLVDAATNAVVTSLVSAADGGFSAVSLPFKNYKLVGKLAGYLDSSGTFQLSAAAPIVDFTLIMQQRIGGVVGRIVDKATRQSIAGASVKIGSLTATTDANGGFSMASMASGQYAMAVDASGYGSVAAKVSVISGQINNVGDVELVAASANPDFAELIGVVKDKVTGAPISGATVSVYLTAVASNTDSNGTYVLTDIPLGTSEIRIIAPGYLPTTLKMSMPKANKYRLDATLAKVDANSVLLSVATDAASYGAYSTAKVTTSFVVSSGVSAQYGYVEGVLLDVDGKVVKTLPEAGSGATGVVWLPSTTPAYVMPLSTGNLTPGEYRLDVSLYDGQATNGRSNRVLLSVATTMVTITPTRRIEAITAIPLPEYANFNQATSTGYRLEIANKSNVPIDFDMALNLLGPSAVPMAVVNPHIQIRPDEQFKQMDIPFGAIAFNPHGQYRAIASVSGVDPPALTTGMITVLPGIRIEATKRIQPNLIPPGADHRLHIDIRIKGVEQ